MPTIVTPQPTPVPPSSALEYLRRVNAYEMQSERVFALSSTQIGDIPNTGSTTYNGQIALIVGPDNADRISIAGDSEITVTFNTGAVDGTFDNLFGTGVGPGVRDYDGTINVEGGANSVVGNGFTADYAGSISDGRSDLSLDGTLIGAFSGPNADAIIGADNSNVDLNGTSTSGALVVVAED